MEQKTGNIERGLPLPEWRRELVGRRLRNDAQEAFSVPLRVRRIWAEAEIRENGIPFDDTKAEVDIESINAHARPHVSDEVKYIWAEAEREGR